MERIKLFCLPYAGGSAMIYSSWKKLMPHNIEVIPVELTGRGARANTPFYQSISDDGTDDLFQSIQMHLDGCPYAILGHSMGTLFAYELSHRIIQETKQSPIHLFISGRKAPHVPQLNTMIHALPDAEFQEKIIQLGGTPKELFDHKELKDLFLPILRADYRLVETYEYVEKPDKLDSDITVLWGKRDQRLRSEAAEWERYTKRKFRMEDFDGDHFFINEYKQQVISVIHRSLALTAKMSPN